MRYFLCLHGVFESGRAYRNHTNIPTHKHTLLQAARSPRSSKACKKVCLLPTQEQKQEAAAEPVAQTDGNSRRRI
jgi:hypothetical protein